MQEAKGNLDPWPQTWTCCSLPLVSTTHSHSTTVIFFEYQQCQWEEYPHSPQEGSTAVCFTWMLCIPLTSVSEGVFGLTNGIESMCQQGCILPGLKVGMSCQNTLISKFLMPNLHICNNKLSFWCRIWGQCEEWKYICTQGIQTWYTYTWEKQLSDWVLGSLAHSLGLEFYTKSDNIVKCELFFSQESKIN